MLGTALPLNCHEISVEFGGKILRVRNSFSMSQRMDYPCEISDTKMSFGRHGAAPHPLNSKHQGTNACPMSVGMVIPVVIMVTRNISTGLKWKVWIRYWLGPIVWLGRHMRQRTPKRLGSGRDPTCKLLWGPWWRKVREEKIWYCHSTRSLEGSSSKPEGNTKEKELAQKILQKRKEVTKMSSTKQILNKLIFQQYISKYSVISKPRPYKQGGRQLWVFVL